MKITLQRALDPSRKIQAIKALRDASGEPGERMGLREAKDIVDGLIPVYAHSQPRAVAGVEVTDTAPLVGIFDFTVEHDPSTSIPRDLALDLLLEAVACMTRAESVVFRATSAFEAVRKAL